MLAFTALLSRVTLTETVLVPVVLVSERVTPGIAAVITLLLRCKVTGLSVGSPTIAMASCAACKVSTPPVPPPLVKSNVVPSATIVIALLSPDAVAVRTHRDAGGGALPRLGDD